MTLEKVNNFPVYNTVATKEFTVGFWIRFWLNEAYHADEFAAIVNSYSVF